MNDEILRVENLKKHFPVTRGIVFRSQIGAVRAVDGDQLHGAAGGDARRGRRVRLREVDDGALHHAPPRPDRRHDHLRRPRHHEAVAGGDAARPPRHDDDLPGPVRVAEPTQAGRLHRRRGPARVRGVHGGGDQAAGAGAARDRRSQPGALQPLPARVLGRRASASCHRPRPVGRSEDPGLRRAGLGAGCVGAGADPQPLQAAANGTPGLSYLFITHDLARWCARSPTA